MKRCGCREDLLPGYDGLRDASETRGARKGHRKVQPRSHIREPSTPGALLGNLLVSLLYNTLDKGFLQYGFKGDIAKFEEASSYGHATGVMKYSCGIATCLTLKLTCSREL